MRVTTASNVGEFVAYARPRMRRRRSRWNLLSLLAGLGSWALLSYAVVGVLSRVHSMTHPGQPGSGLPDDAAGLMMLLGAIFTSFAPAMILANFLVWLVPVARRTFEAEAEPFPDITFESVNRGFRRMAHFMVPIGLAVGLFGACLP